VNVNDSIKKTAGLPIATPQSVPARAGNNAAKTGETSSATASDSVKLSSQYQALEIKVADNESFNAQKVEEIKTAIANGQFQINPEKVAAGLIDTVQNLLSTRK
jgi:negative regulator of flagellin synthesis FlgM